MTAQTANRGGAAAKTYVPEGDSTPPGWPGVSRLPAWLHAEQTAFRGWLLAAMTVLVLVPS